MERDLVALLVDDTGGDPMTKQRWVRLSLKRLGQLLAQRGHAIDPKTVRRLLHKLKYSLKANRKRFTGPPHPDRDRQFRYIAHQKRRFLKAGRPVISVDTKKKELIGNFQQDGQTWCHEADEVNAYDFLSDAEGRATPYGIYLVQHDRGYVYVGESADTPEFAVDAIVSWWKSHGRRRFPDATKLLILADSGGSNGCRPRMWKRQLQERLADAFNLEVTVCHYPRGGSKWNPIEHRLFSFISINWAGKPLRSWLILLGYIQDTRTETGLQVKAVLLRGNYERGLKVTDHEMRKLRLRRHKTCPSWNYTIRPRQGVSGAAKG
ncbi:ISAzo13 family transposase [Fimbriiglobus ruber]|uniref:ISAzo13 family transposase n=1 Tax=Fimbriiglobus ruber TaxID=1908690 RepID=UPI0030845485